MADIFISYSRNDSEQALALVDRLRAHGMTVWIDQHGLEAATSWSKEIANALQQCDVMLLLLSSTAVSSVNVAKELSAASQLHKRIVPVQLERVELQGEFLYHLSGLQRAKYDDFDSILRAVAKTDQEVSPNTTNSTEQAPPRARKTRLRAIVAASIILVLGAVGYFAFRPSSSGSTASTVKTLLVLPFESLSADKENEYFADGMTATLIDMLVPVTDLQVADRSTSMEFKSSKRDVKEISKLVGCRYIVNGTVQREADRILINAQMSDAETGSVLFSKSFFGSSRDLFQLQQQIAQNIVVELQLSLSTDSVYVPLGGKPASPEAWDLCMRADYEESHNRIDSSIALYVRATQFSPYYAHPYLQAAREYGNKYMGDTTATRSLVLADSFLAIGRKLDTAQLYSHFVGSWIATVHHDYDRAISEATAYLKKQPRRSGGYYLLALAYATSKQYGLAADNFLESLKRDPTAPQDRFMVLYCLWFAHDTVRLHQQAAASIPIFEAWLKWHPDDKSVSNNSIPLALVWSGRGDEACKRMEDLLRTPNVDSQYVLNTAAISALSGKLDRAMEIMRGKIARSGVQSVDFERPFFDNLRNLPEFQSWVKQKEALPKKHG
ncbi:MAG: TIR domain-containing protein [Bacteroidetes bacterium]|nr:TIR domain-containing protein [Bacteroidota bacterium]